MNYLIGLFSLMFLVACGDKDEDTADTAEAADTAESTETGGE